MHVQTRDEIPPKRDKLASFNHQSFIRSLDRLKIGDREFEPEAMQLRLQVREARIANAGADRVAQLNHSFDQLLEGVIG